jgi:hypothetical protein
MFNPEKLIAEWRRRMLAGGVKSPRVLDELESHLREDMARQAQSGIGGQEAFEAAARRIGEARALKAEFAKTGRKRYAFICFLIGLILFFSGETILHMQMSVGEEMTAFGAVALVLVIACGWRYVIQFLPVDFFRQKIAAVRPACGFYLKATAFLMPTALIWLLSAFVVMPKLREICHAAGSMSVFNFGDAPASFRAWAQIVQVMVFLTAHDLSIGGAFVLAFILLEWRSRGWQRYRRATVGAGIFVFNFAVLLSLMLMMISALIASQSLMSHVK